MAVQEDYNSQPDEDLDMTPEWKKGRPVVTDELEDQLEPPPYDVWKIMRGQARGKAGFMAKKVKNDMTCSGKFKEMIKVKEDGKVS